MSEDSSTRIRRLMQQYAYTSLQMHETIARKAGLPGTDHRYLGFFLQKPEMTAGELSKLTGLTTGAVTGLIDRFEKKKFVKRQLASEDRRKVIIVADTKKIMAVLGPLYHDFRTRTQKLIASFSGKEARAIETFFAQSIEIMTATTETLDKPK